MNGFSMNDELFIQRNSKIKAHNISVGRKFIKSKKLLLILKMTPIKNQSGQTIIPSAYHFRTRQLSMGD